MKICFIHDHKFKFDLNNIYYTDGKFTNELFDRYIVDKDDQVNVISRKVPIKDFSIKLNKVDHPQVIFSCVRGVNPLQIFIFNCIYNFKIFYTVIKSDLNIMRLPSFLGLFCCLLCLIFRKKYFVEVVGHTRDSLLDNNSKLIRKLIANLYSFFAQMAIKNATGAIYVTKYALQKDYPCLGLTEFASNVILKIQDQQNPKKDYIISDIPKLGLIGSFNNGYKGIDFAIKLISVLKNTHNRIVHLHILGQGSLLNEYQKLVNNLKLEDQVFFDGLLPLEEVPIWLDHLDLYIQPSLTEGLPRSLIEAMSRGLPCIASDVGGIPELLSTEYLFSEFDESVVAEMLENLLRHQKVREFSGQTNYINSLEYSFENLEKRRRKFWSNAKNA